jgi:hypothetical protein
MDRDTAKQMFLWAHRMEKEDVLESLLCLSRELNSLVHYYPEYRDESDLYPMAEYELFFLGTDRALKLFDELLIENPNTIKILETFVYRSIEVERYCNDLDISNPMSQNYLPLIRRVVTNIVSNYQISVKSNKKKTIELPSAFKDIHTLRLFYYLNDNWDNTTQIKYAYIYEFLVTKNNFKIVSKVYYEFFVRERYKVIGKFNYDNANSEKHFEKLNELLTTFNQNIPKLG